MNRLKGLARRARNLAFISLLIGWQAGFALVPILQTSLASAAPVCVNDTAGANDEPGQKDLTKLCIDEANLPTSEHVTWNWDETGTSGANTLDGCALFDTDGDGNINYSVCVTTTGNPAVIQSTTLYSCGDDKVDRCTSPTTPLIITNGTTCSVSQQNTDPFPTGASNPKDTEASCTLFLADVGGGNVAKLIDVCSYPSQQPNSDPSDCVIIKPKSGKLEVIKDLVPNTDPGLFNLQIDSVTKAANVGDNGTTGEQVVSEGSHVVGETPGTNTALTTYDTTIICKDLNGTGSVVASGSPTGTTSRQLTLTVPDGSDIVCTITNNVQQGTLILQKTVINDNGGTLTQANFPVQINGNTAAWGSNTVSPGAYTVSETQQTGYQASVWGGDCDSTGHVTVVNGGTKTCTITNNDIGPQLTVIKHVVNDNGGTKAAGDFTMNVTGTNVSDSSFPGDEAGTTVTLNAGSYSVDEDAVGGYAKNLGTNCSGTIALGEKKTCTITNDDIAPKLTIIKEVVNDDGGTLTAGDFPLNVSGVSVTSGQQYTSFNAGTYTVGETQQTGYTLDGFSGNCLANGSITLEVGGVYTCTVTNNDQPAHIKVTKVVVNNNGGQAQVSDFALNVGNTQVTSGVNNTFNAHQQYTVSETGIANYTQTSLVCVDASSQISVGSTFTPVNGQSIECTITNDDNGPSLTLNKVLVKDNGGTASESDWTLTATGPTTISGQGAAGSADVVSGTGFSAGTYTLSESAGPSGYSASNWSCTNGVTVDGNSQITIGLGQSTVCTITNNDIGPQLTVIKHVVNDNGGTKAAGDFTMNVTGTNVSDSSFPGDEAGTTVTLNAGSYSVDEDAVGGYAKTIGAYCSGTIAVGQHKTCTITNNDVQPKLTVIKQLGDLFGNGAVVSDFDLFVNLTPVLSGQTNGFDVGNYVVSENNLPGFVNPVFTGDCDANGNVSLALADNKTCTITNTAEQPKLKVIKHVINDNGGTASADDFTMNVTGTNVSDPSFAGNESGTTVTLNEGSFSVDEDAFAGYAKSFSGDCSGTITIGETKTCTITNNDVAPKLTLVKYVVNKAGSNASATDWTLTATGPTSISGTTGVTSGSDFSAGTYNLSESGGPAGYTAGDWNCQGGQQNNASVTISLTDDVTCSITNTRDTGFVKVKKYVNPSSDNGLFNLNISGYPGSSANNVGNGGSTGSVEVITGSYTASETAGTDTDLSDYSSTYVCKNGEWQVVANGQGTVTVPFNVNNGDSITCTFTNVRLPKLKIVKDAQPNSDQVFDFTSAKLGDFSLVDDGNSTNSKQFEKLAPGIYQVTEQSVDGWDLGSLSCSNELWDRTSSTLTVELVAGDDVTCTFTNQKRTEIQGHKFNDVNGDSKWSSDEPTLANWTINLYRCSIERELSDSVNQINQPFCDDTPIATTQTDSSGAYSFENLTRGSYKVCEVQQDKWTQTFPTDNGGCHMITLSEPGQEVTADFGNKAKPQVLAEEIVNTGNPALTNLLVGLPILGAVTGLSIITRRSRKYSE